MFVWTVIKRTVGIAFVVIGLFTFGMKGLLAGVLLNTWFSFFVNIWLVSKHIGYKLFTQLLDLLPILVLAIISFTVAYCIVYLIPEVNMYILALIRLFVFVAIYLGGSVLFKMESFRYLKESLPMFLAKFKKKSN
jgi:hypothetical protein